MTLLDAIKRLDKSKEVDIDLEEIAYSIGIQEYQFNEDERLKRYWLASHTCTDKVVGISLLFLDGICVGYSQQLARKSDIEYNWFSEADYMAIREYIMSILKTDYYNPNHELDSDIRDIEYFRSNDEKLSELNIIDEPDLLLIDDLNGIAYYQEELEYLNKYIDELNGVGLEGHRKYIFYLEDRKYIPLAEKIIKEAWAHPTLFNGDVAIRYKVTGKNF